MNIKNFIESKKGKYVALVVVLFFFTLIVFKMGIEVGFREARFSNRLGDNYSRNFLGDKDGFMGMMRGGLAGGYGASGKVVRIELPNIVVATQDNLEKIIRLSDDTLVRQYRDSITSADIKIGDNVVVIGYPSDDGEIVAKLIRVVPLMMNVQATTTVPKK